LAFDSFSAYILYCCLACGGLLAFGLLAAQVKKPFTSVSYILIAICCGMLMLQTSQLCFGFESTVEEKRFNVCKESAKVPEIEIEF